ncbi:MAG: UbiA prenyltransferase family protein [Thermoplasmata archaeon]|nr:UbiA prenyltransferase family protein [Thermoplasmata archaeon]
MIRAYLKLSRSFNAALTAIAPVMGAIAAGEMNVFKLLLFFFAGFFGHSYGFALNDIFDYKIDRLSKELTERPLVKGELSLRNAWLFTIFCLIASFSVAIYISYIYNNYFSIIFLLLSAISITIYDMISKKYPAMDIFVATGIFLLIVYGSFTVAGNIGMLPLIVALLGTLQVLFMQFIAGGLKDAEHDFKANARTLAIKLGVRVENGIMHVPITFSALAYTLQFVFLVILFYPFIFIDEFRGSYIQIFLLIILSVAMLFVSHRLLSLKKFNRDVVRKYIGMHYYINFSLTPIMLSSLNPYIAIIALIPAISFISSNLILHGSIIPKTM